MLPIHLRQVRQEERKRAQQHCRARDIRAARSLRARKVQICVMMEECHEDHMRHLHALLVAALKEAHQAKVLVWARSNALNCAHGVRMYKAPCLDRDSHYLCLILVNTCSVS